MVILLANGWKRTCTALVVGFSRHHRNPAECGGVSGLGIKPALVSIGADPMAFAAQRLQKNSSGRRLFLSSSSSSSSSSSFQPPTPPESKGQAVYEDIDIHAPLTATSPSSLRNADENSVFVVTGASRGIGLQLVKTLLSDTKGTIVACCRDPNNAQGLQEVIQDSISQSKERIYPITLDLESPSSIEAAAREIQQQFSRVDMLLNVAGILGDGGKETPAPERSLAKIESEWLEKTFRVNVFGPVLLAKELKPIMGQSRRSTTRTGPAQGRPNAVIANLSARVGSISDNQLGGWYSYRMSKSALNQATRTMAHELKRESIWCIALHPGTTDTDLSKPFQRNVAQGRLFPVDFTVTSLFQVINAMDDKNSGGLYDWAGKAIPF